MVSRLNKVKSEKSNEIESSVMRTFYVRENRLCFDGQYICYRHLYENQSLLDHS